jgi:uracil phosphoribosyltransferase
LVIVVASVIATANTAAAAIVRLKERRAKEIRYVCLVASRQGLQKLRDLHPDVPIWTAAIDEDLDDHAFIVPGLGDRSFRDFAHEVLRMQRGFLRHLVN